MNREDKATGWFFFWLAWIVAAAVIGSVAYVWFFTP